MEDEEEEEEEEEGMSASLSEAASADPPLHIRYSFLPTYLPAMLFTGQRLAVP